MYSHVFLGVDDFARALAFYDALMAVLGLPRRFVDADKPWAGWQTPGTVRPLFVICHPWDGAAHARGNGQMVAFDAASRAVVDAAWRTALAHGGADEGAPGPRPYYHADYYGAYFRDPDGNKLCVVCHAAPDAVAR